MILYEAHTDGGCRVVFRQEAGIYDVYAWQVDTGRTAFRDRTDSYAQAVGWLARFLSTHGRPELRTIRAHAAAGVLKLPPLPSEHYASAY